MYKMKINGQNYEAQIVEYNRYNAKIIVNGIDFLVEFGEDEEIATPVNFKPQVKAPTPIVEPSSERQSIVAPQPATPTQTASGSLKQIKAPLPGTVSDIKVAIGQTIETNQVVIILEAMKMESEIYSEHSGIVKNILITKGQNVHDGQVMIEIE